MGEWEGERGLDLGKKERNKKVITQPFSLHFEATFTRGSRRILGLFAYFSY